MHPHKANPNKNRIKHAFLHISQSTIKVFSPLLLVLLIEFIWFAVAFCLGMASDPIQAIDKYNSISEHLMMSLLLTLGSAMIFDIAMFEKDKK